MAGYDLLSLNVRGLRNKCKRQQLFQWLKHYHNGSNCYILLQETHSTVADEKAWQNDWGSQILFGHGTSKSCGVAILLPIKYNFDDIKVVIAESRKLCIELSTEENSIAILNVYAPTKDNAHDHVKFVESLRNEFEEYSDRIIVGGDFNFYLNAELDKDKCTNEMNKASI